MEIALIGLALSGKSTVFRALTRGHAQSVARGAVEPAVGVVKVPDERLDRLCAVLRPKKVTHLEVRYLDFPGAFTARGEGPPSAVLAALAQADALAHVVRAFRDETVPHPEGSVDPHRDIGALHLELAFADAAVLERRRQRLEPAVRSARAGEREQGERELALIERLREALEEGTPIRAQTLTPDERRLLSGYQLLTDKPLLLLINIDEADIGRAEEIEGEVRERWGGPGIVVAALCAKLEQELTELSEEDAAAFRRDLGLREGVLDRVLRLSQEALGLITFFTVNEAEGRAWAVPAGTTAVEAAGKIHSDMARGFIRAEVISWEDLVACGSFAEARRKGLLRTEGKQYVVQDGELLHILFNV